jgi:cell division protein FtsB
MQTRRRSTIRWDRVGRFGLAAVLGVIVLLYISPAKHWIEQSRTYDEQHSELRDLTRQNRTLKQQVKTLATPGALEREARRLGMVKVGERAYVIENLPTR